MINSLPNIDELADKIKTLSYTFSSSNSLYNISLESKDLSLIFQILYDKCVKKKIPKIEKFKEIHDTVIHQNLDDQLYTINCLCIFLNKILLHTQFGLDDFNKTYYNFLSELIDTIEDDDDTPQDKKDLFRAEVKKIYKSGNIYKLDISLIKVECFIEASNFYSPKFEITLRNFASILYDILLEIPYYKLHLENFKNNITNLGAAPVLPTTAQIDSYIKNYKFIISIFYIKNIDDLNEETFLNRLNTFILNT